MAIRFAIVAAVVGMLAWPAAAITVTFDTGLYVGKFFINNTEAVRSLDVTGDGMDIRVCALTLGMDIGTLRIAEDGAGGYAVDYDGPNFTWEVQGNGDITISFVTQPLTFDIGDYQGGWWLNEYGPSWQARGNKTYDLPVEFSGANFYTPGSNNYFSRSADGTVTVGSSDRNIGLAGGQDIITIAQPLELTYTTNFPAERWVWAGDGPTAGGIGNKPSNDGHLAHDGDAETVWTINYLPGGFQLESQIIELAGGWVGSRMFNIPDYDDAIGWSQTVYYELEDGTTYFFTLNGPAVPEPMTMSLLTLGGVALLRRRR